MNEIAYFPGSPLGQDTEILIMKSLMHGYGLNFDLNNFLLEPRCWSKPNASGALDGEKQRCDKLATTF